MNIKKNYNIIIICLLLILKLSIFITFTVITSKLIIVSAIDMFIIILLVVIDLIYKKKTIINTLILSFLLLFILSISIEIEIHDIVSNIKLENLSFWLLLSLGLINISMLFLVSKKRKSINENLKFSFHWQVFTGMVYGILAAILIPDFMISIGFVGKVFIKALQMFVAPLVLTSIFMGIAQLGNIKHLGSIGWKTIVFYISTTIIAIMIGVFGVSLIEPGVGLDSDELIKKLSETDNLSSSEQVMDKVKAQPDSVGEFVEVQISKIFTNIFSALSTNTMLAIIFFSILFAIAALSIGEKGKPIIRFFDGLNEIFLKIIRWIMLTAPIGIFALIGMVIADFGWEILSFLLDYALTVIICLGIHAIFVLPSIIAFVARFNLIKFFKGTFTAIITAFSTASSTATLPISLKVAREELKISPKISDFVIPLGATINMNGTALYEAVAAIFIAQIYGIELTVVQQIIIVITATLAAIGAAGIPHAGLVTMVIIFNAIGLRIEGIMLIIAVDRILDMLRTSINVYGDLAATVTVNRWQNNTQIIK